MKRLFVIFALCLLTSCKPMKKTEFTTPPSVGASNATERVVVRVGAAKKTVDEVAKKVAPVYQEQLGRAGIDMQWVLEKDLPEAKDEIERLNRDLMASQGDNIAKEVKLQNKDEQIADLKHYNANRWVGDKTFALGRWIAGIVIVAWITWGALGAYLPFGRTLLNAMPFANPWAMLRRKVYP